MALGAALWLASAPLTANENTLPPPVRQALEQAGIPPPHVSVVVQPLGAARPLISHNASHPMNPASVMKLLTTYAGLDILGPAWRWRTTAWADTPPDGDSLPGNLYLRGSGDPHFAIEHLSALLRQLRSRGIREIRGDIVTDSTAFALPAFDPAAFDKQPMRPYNVGPDALLLNFHAAAFTLLPGPPTPRVLADTPLADLEIDNRLQASDGPCGSDWKERIRTQLTNDTPARLELTGTYSSQCGERRLHLAPLPPDDYRSRLIRALWQELGGALLGEVRPGRTPAEASLLVQHDSPPLADAVREINKFSNNVMARQVFLSLASTTPVTSEAAAQRLTAWLGQRKLRFPELVLDNGAGLSRTERWSAGSINQLLQDAWRSPVMPEFMASLPIAGSDGTMQKRLGSTAAAGRAHIKTGTLDGVRSAAGYLLDQQGERYSVAFLINDPRASAGRPAIDALLAWLANRPGRAAP